MTEVSQSPMLQALGYAIVNSLWQFGLLWLVYVALNCIGSLSSHKKYAAAIALQFSGFVWFFLTLAFYYNQCLNVVRDQVATTSFLDFGHAVYNGSFKDRVLMGILQAEQFLPYLSIAYLALLAALLFKWLRSFNTTTELRRFETEKIDVGYRLFVDRVARQMNIKKPVKIFLSHLAKSPLTVGHFKPLILIPIASINHLSQEQLEAVLLHELAHIKRNDYLLNMILSVAEVVLFFNPFMQLLARHIRRERENSCDDWVLQYEYNASTYAKALLTIATLQSESRKMALAMHAVDQKHSLLIRVKRMIEKKDRTFNYRNQLFALLLLSGALSIIAYMTPVKKTDSLTKASHDDVKIEPLVANVDNPLFNPVFFLIKDKANKQKEGSATETKTAKVVNTLPPVTLLDLAKTPDEPLPANEPFIASPSKPLTSLAQGPTILSIVRDTLMLMPGLQMLWRLPEFASNIEVKVQGDVNKENARIVLEKGKVLQQLKTVLSQVERSLNDKKRAESDTRILGQGRIALAKAEEQLKNQQVKLKELAASDERLQRYYQLTAYDQPAAYGSATSSGGQNAYNFVYQVPNVEGRHIFSFDYEDKHVQVSKPATPAAISIGRAAAKSPVNNDDDDSTGDDVLKILETQVRKLSDTVTARRIRTSVFRAKVLKKERI